MVSENGQLLMNNAKVLQDIGSTIVGDTARLATDLQSSQQQFKAAFNGEGGTDVPGYSLSACLLQDFENYEQQQTFDGLLQERRQIGEVLSRAVSLLDFQAQLSQEPFNIYGLNTYYDGGRETVPGHLLVPDGFALHPNSH